MIQPASQWRASFGPFTLTPSRRLLERNGMPVRLGGRALDLLIALVERAGETVGKQELLARVWPDVVVEEGSLRFHMVAVRKALGDGEDGRRYIVSSPNKGYTFVAEAVRSVLDTPVRQPDPGGPGALPSSMGLIVGRDDDVARIARAILEHRFVSVVGAGGMGKTTVAIAAAHGLARTFADRVHFADLSSISSAELVPATIARLLGARNGSDDPDDIAAAIGEHPALVLLDCCEHVINGAAEIGELLMRKCPRVCILATSREPLRAGGEIVFRLQPLEFPPDGEGDTAESALAFPAVKLFVDRAAASGGYVLSDLDAPLASRLCRELGGVPLAIELAAGRVQAFGLAVITSHFDANERLSWQGRRTAMPRQQTLGATLEWSYKLLSEDEKRLLRRLSVFAASFSLEAALHVCCFDQEEHQQSGTELLAGLVCKSLVNVDSGGNALRYGLFGSTKAFAWHKLVESGEQAQVLGRFAQFFFALALEYEDRLSIRSLGQELPNFRSAIEWYFRPEGNPADAVRFASVFCPILLQLSQLRECSRWAKAALAQLPEPLRGSRYEAWLQLHSARGENFTASNSVRPGEASRAYRRGIEVAETLRDRQTILHLLNGYAVSLHRGGRFTEALSVAHRAKAIAREIDDEECRTLVDSLMGAALHLTGHIAQADSYLQRSAAAAAKLSASTESSLGFDHRIRSLSGLARNMWLMGSYSQAVALARTTIAEARDSDHGVTHCLALIWAGSVYAWQGDCEAMEETVDELEIAAARHSFSPYLSIAAATRAQIAIRNGHAAEGVERIRKALEDLHACRYEMVTSAFLTVVAEGLSAMSLHCASVEMCDKVEKLIHTGGDYLRMPELLTARGRCLEAAGRHEEATRNYSAAIDMARTQGASFLQVRAAVAQAQQFMRMGRVEEARAFARTHAATASGDAHPDLVLARSILG